ncbi:MAG: ERAP1-like C-terminal domain-containing protein, partial [Thermoplasmata archaeon]
YEHLHGRNGDETLWRVPVTVRRAGIPETFTFLMEERHVTRSLGVGRLPDPKDWAKVNAGQTGFYRVNYPPEEWERLRSAIEALEMSATDRLGLQNDAYALTRGGFIPATLFLSITEAYRNEKDATVWREVSNNLRAFETILADEAYLPQFYAFARRLYQPTAGRIGWDSRPSDKHLDALLRSTVLGCLGSYEDSQTIREAVARFEAYLEDRASLHPDLRDVVLNLTGQEGDRSVYDTLWELEREATLNEEKVRLLMALTRPKREELLRETLERSLSEEVRSQDTVFVVAGVASNRHGRESAWEFIKDNWAEFDRRYGRGGLDGLTYLVSVTGAFTTLERAEEVEEFFRTHPVPAARRTVQQSLERIRLNAKWLEQNRGELADWFATRD